MNLAWCALSFEVAATFNSNSCNFIDYNVDYFDSIQLKTVFMTRADHSTKRSDESLKQIVIPRNL